jgi:type II secretory pathway component PulK
MSRHAERGFMLIVALIILAVSTLLVVGAIAFTGSERSAAANQLKSEVLSACTHAARNLFLSRVNVLRGNVTQVTLDAGIVLSDAGVNEHERMHVRTGHFDQAINVALTDVNRLPGNQVGGSSSDVQDLSNRLGQNGLLAGYYNITAVCTDKETNAQQEIEFVVRLGL